jgi:hypothetical protein
MCDGNFAAAVAVPFTSVHFLRREHREHPVNKNERKDEHPVNMNTADFWHHFRNPDRSLHNDLVLANKLSLHGVIKKLEQVWPPQYRLRTAAG